MHFPMVVLHAPNLHCGIQSLDIRRIDFMVMIMSECHARYTNFIYSHQHI